MLQSGDELQELPPVDVIAGCDGVSSVPWPLFCRFVGILSYCGASVLLVLWPQLVHH